MVELVVAMMISAIVISIAFYAWSFFTGQLTKRRARAASIMEYVLFQRALARDIDKAQAIRDSAGAVVLLGVDSHNVRYAFGSDRILRDLDGVTDTFRVGTKAVDRSYVNDSLPLVSNLRLVLTVGRDDLMLGLHKEYSIAEMLRAQKMKNE
jgi:type II secretory pathway pseudopilin PulG